MAIYRVQLFRGDWYNVDVEATDEDHAIEEALNDAPYLCAQCSGWGHSAKGSVSPDEWMTPDECFPDYKESVYGPVVELIEGDE